jgi:NAD(P)-dependent dehydrogenase (short-subunit alcohol dehydrogenase family)
VFANSTILLTGVGGQGQVGEAVAKAVASLGASLILVDRTREHVDARAQDLAAAGAKVRPYACDLTNPDEVARLVAWFHDNVGEQLDALVHMAGGFAMSGPVAESQVEVWHKQIAINLTTAYLVSRAFLPLLRNARGSLVFFASEAALPGSTGANMSAYAVAKSGVVALMRAIAAEEGKHGVRANAIAPTSIRTSANVAAMGTDQHYIEREQVADLVTYLCSPRASAISGALIPLTHSRAAT